MLQKNCTCLATSILGGVPACQFLRINHEKFQNRDTFIGIFENIRQVQTCRRQVLWQTSQYWKKYIIFTGRYTVQSTCMLQNLFTKNIIQYLPACECQYLPVNVIKSILIVPACVETNWNEPIVNDILTLHRQVSLQAGRFINSWHGQVLSSHRQVLSKQVGRYKQR